MSLLPNSLASLALRLAVGAALIGALRVPDQCQQALPTWPQPAAADADETSLADAQDDPQPLANMVRSRAGFNLCLPERTFGKEAAVAARHKCVSPGVLACSELDRTAGHGGCSRPVRLLFCVWVI